MEVFSILLAVWVGVGLGWMFFSTLLLACSEMWSDRKKFSRGIFLGPVWPLVILYWIWRGLVGLWTMTDWDLKDLKKRR